MREGVRHPRLFSAFRAALYVAAGVLAALLALAGVIGLVVILVFAAAAVLTAVEVNLLAVGGLAALVVLLVGGSLAVLHTAVRRVERRVRRADRLPDPLDELRREYVADAIDERELERRLGGVLDTDDPRTGRDRWSPDAQEHPVYSDDAALEEEDAST